MDQLRSKFQQASSIMTMELDKDEAKLFNRQLKDEDLTEYRNINKMKGRTDSGIDNAMVY